MTQNEKSKIRAKVIKWVTRLFLILVAIIMLYPLAWNVVSSFKTSTEFLTDPFAWPQGLAWDNYVRAYEKSNLAANIGNSIYVVLETLVIIVICVVPCSYCLVRYKFPGAKLILNIYMAAIFIQATYIMIPLFLQMNKLNLLNSLTALGVLYATMQFPFAIFLLTGFLRSSTADLSTTLTWALMTTALVWYNNIKNNGFFGWLKGFTEPVVVMTPMNIISEIAQPISMSFRHFGNIAGGSVLTALIYGGLSALSSFVLGWIPSEFISSIPIFQVGIPAILSIYFDLFTGCIQALVFCMLTMVYVGAACPAPAPKPEKK